MTDRAGWTVLVVTAVAGILSPLPAQQYPHPSEMQLPEAQFVMPDTNRFRFLLENRMMGFVIPDPTVPLVTFSAFVRGGYGDEDDGAADALALMLSSRGPCWLGTERLQDVLEQMAAEFSVTMGPELTEITLNVSARDARDGLRVFSGIVRETCIDDVGLDAFRAQAARAAERARAPATRYEASLAGAVAAFEDLLYADHRYQRVVTVEQAAQLELDDVEDFYREYFSPVNVTLAVSGAFDMREMLDAVDQRFADWEDRSLPQFRRAPNIEMPEPRAATELAVDGALQTWIVIGHELPAVEPRDYPALEVMNYILGGGHFDTRLFREARDQRGLTNDASGFLEPNYRGPGSYTFRTSSRPDVSQQLIDIVFAEIERIREEDVTDEELTVAKGALADGAFAYRFRDGHAVARTFAIEWSRYITFDHLVRYQDRVRDVDAGDVRRAARRYLQPERMRIVTLGAPVSDP